MAKKKRNVISEMLGRGFGTWRNPQPGKLSAPQTGWLRIATQSIFGRQGNTAAQIDYTKNDYDLFSALYYNSIINGAGEPYLLAAALGKPIINVITGYTIGEGFTVEIDNPNADANIQAGEDEINAWLQQNMSKFYDYFKFGFRDGDGYIHLDELCNVTLLDPRGVTAVLDPLTGRLIGFDILDQVSVTEAPQQGQKAEEKSYYYLRRYRLDSVQIVRYENESDFEQGTYDLIYQKMFTTNGTVDIPDAATQAAEAGTDPIDSDANYNPYEVVERSLPVIHFANEAEAKAVYGNSEYQNVLALFHEYSDVMKSAKINVKYNSQPIPVINGVQDSSAFEAASQNAVDDDEEATEGAVIGKDSVIYVNGQGAGASFLRATGLMADAESLLQLYFYLMVQGSETPEFVLGTAVSSSKASTDSQSPILIKKIKRKQLYITAVIQKIVQTYIEKQQLLANPTFLATTIADTAIRVNFPAIDDEDLTITLAAVTFALENGIMSKKTALELILGGKVKDATEEVKQAAKEASDAAAAAAPAQQDRLIKALNGNTPTPSSTGDEGGE